MNTQVAQRVVVMGLEGYARDQLVSALSEFGVTPVWVGKPLQSNPELLIELNPNKIIVSLEPSIEPDLEQYSDFLCLPTITVLYDDAETTRTLSGWDLNRWARHMAAKLLDKELLPQQAIIADNVSEGNALEDHSKQWDKPEVVLEAAPNRSVPNADIQVDMESHLTWNDTEHYDTLEINPEELNAALERLNASLSKGFQAEALINFDVAVNPDTPSSILQLPPLENELQEVSFMTNVNSNSINEFSSDDLSALEFDTDFGRNNSSSKSSYVLTLKSEAEHESILQELTNQIAEIPHFDLSKYTLLDPDVDVSNNNTDSNQGSNTANDSKLKPMLLVISGLGAPAPMRTLLGGIEVNFNGIIVFSHDIDSIQLPKLCDQLQKISKIPMQLPETDEFLKNGNIYVLNKKQTIQSTSLGYQCIAGHSLSDYILQMDPNLDIVILSGADALLSHALIQVSSLLHNTHVQAPDDCFDPSLVQLLVNMGAPLVSHDVLEKWFN